MTRRPPKRPSASLPTEKPQTSGKGGAPLVEQVLAPWKRALFDILIVILWGALLGALEVALRVSGYGYDTSLFLEVEDGVRIDNPDYTLRFFSAAGSRDQARPSNLFKVEKTPGVYRIFVVGESTAQGFPFQRGHSFSQIAGAALTSQGIRLEIINLGNSALSSYYVRETLQEIGQYDPDLVVIYAGHNEHYGSPSLFTGGTHLTRLAILELRKLRGFQLFESAVVRAVGKDEAEGESLMEERFAEFLHPFDESKDEEVAELFVRNLRRGAEPLLRSQVPILIFEPVSNLVSMPPFRSASATETSAVGGPPSALSLYQMRLSELEAGGEWNRERWEEIRDLDEAPFRARSTLVRRLEEYVRGEPAIRWIPTSDEMEERVGYRAFTDDFFIDHLHFNFEGQTLIASILADAIAETLLPNRPELAPGMEEFFADTRRVREAVHLTDFWEFAAYSTIVALMEEEPFRSMQIPKASPLTEERALANPIYTDETLLNIYRDVREGADIFHTTLEYYYRTENREEWVRNMNSYIYLFPGHFASHLAYGIALISDDPQNNLDMAASYFRQAFILSQRSEEIRNAIKSEFGRVGITTLWPAFEIQYLQ